MKCPKCGTEADKLDVRCKKCGYEFTDDSLTNCYDKIFLAIATIIFIAGFIVGIALGNSVKANVLDDFGDARQEFNTTLMLIIWVGSALAGMCFMGVSWHLKNQRAIIDRLDKIIEQNGEE